MAFKYFISQVSQIVPSVSVDDGFLLSLFYSACSFTLREKKGAQGYVFLARGAAEWKEKAMHTLYNIEQEEGLWRYGVTRDEAQIYYLLNSF